MNYFHTDLPTKNPFAFIHIGNKADFPIDVLPLYSRDPVTDKERVLSDRHARVVVRTDTNEHLGILGPRTEPIPYARTMQATDEALNHIGLRYDSKTQVYDNGATVRRLSLIHI